MNIGCKIIYDITRPDPALVAKFRGLPVANIDDCMNRIAAVDSAIRPMNKAPLLGTAFTIRLPEGDNLMFHKAMDMAAPGDVVVIDAGGATNRAIFGELMLTYCHTRGIAGVVVDGAIRDVGAISQMDIPVYARGISPNGPYKNGPGEINVPVVIGGKIVFPGDIVVGDEDGLLIVRPENAEEIIRSVLTLNKKEKDIMDNILEKGTYIRPWVDDKLREISCEF